LVTLFVHQVGALDRAERERAAQKQEIRSRIVAAAALVRDNIPRATDRPADECCSDLDVRALRALEADGKLPDLRITDSARNSARTHLEVVVSTGDRGSSGPLPSVRAVSGVAVRGAAGCVVAAAHRGNTVVSLLVAGRTRTVLSSQQGGKMAMWLVPRSDTATRDVPPSTDTYGGPALAAALEPRLPATVEVAGPGRLLIRLTSGATTRFCNAKAA
jgi:hypothetical protein